MYEHKFGNAATNTANYSNVNDGFCAYARSALERLDSQISDIYLNEINELHRMLSEINFKADAEHQRLWEEIKDVRMLYNLKQVSTKETLNDPNIRENNNGNSYDYISQSKEDCDQKSSIEMSQELYTTCESTLTKKQLKKARQKANRKAKRDLTSNGEVDSDVEEINDCKKGLRTKKTKIAVSGIVVWYVINRRRFNLRLL